MKEKSNVSRRAFLGTSAVLATGIVAPGAAANNPDYAEIPIEPQGDLLASTFDSKSGNSAITDVVHAGEHR